MDAMRLAKYLNGAADGIENEMRTYMGQHNEWFVSQKMKEAAWLRSLTDGGAS